MTSIRSRPRVRLLVVCAALTVALAPPAVQAAGLSDSGVDQALGALVEIIGDRAKAVALDTVTTEFTDKLCAGGLPIPGPHGGRVLYFGGPSDKDTTEALKQLAELNKTGQDVPTEIRIAAGTEGKCGNSEACQADLVFMTTCKLLKSRAAAPTDTTLLRTIGKETVQLALRWAAIQMSADDYGSHHMSAIGNYVFAVMASLKGGKVEASAIEDETLELANTLAGGFDLTYELDRLKEWGGNPDANTGMMKCRPNEECPAQKLLLAVWDQQQMACTASTKPSACEYFGDPANDKPPLFPDLTKTKLAEACQQFRDPAAQKARKDAFEDKKLLGTQLQLPLTEKCDSKLNSGDLANCRLAERSRLLEALYKTQCPLPARARTDWTQMGFILHFERDIYYDAYGNGSADRSHDPLEELNQLPQADKPAALRAQIAVVLKLAVTIMEAHRAAPEELAAYLKTLQTESLGATDLYALTHVPSLIWQVSGQPGARPASVQPIRDAIVELIQLVAEYYGTGAPDTVLRTIKAVTKGAQTFAGLNEKSSVNAVLSAAGQFITSIAGVVGDILDDSPDTALKGLGKDLQVASQAITGKTDLSALTALIPDPNARNDPERLFEEGRLRSWGARPEAHALLLQVSQEQQAACKGHRDGACVYFPDDGTTLFPKPQADGSLDTGACTRFLTLVDPAPPAASTLGGTQSQPVASAPGPAALRGAAFGQLFADKKPFAAGSTKSCAALKLSSTDREQCRIGERSRLLDALYRTQCVDALSNTPGALASAWRQMSFVVHFERAIYKDALNGDPTLAGDLDALDAPPGSPAESGALLGAQKVVLLRIAENTLTLLAHSPDEAHKYLDALAKEAPQAQDLYSLAHIPSLTWDHSRPAEVSAVRDEIVSFIHLTAEYNGASGVDNVLETVKTLTTAAEDFKGLDDKSAPADLLAASVKLISAVADTIGTIGNTDPDAALRFFFLELSNASKYISQAADEDWVGLIVGILSDVATSSTLNDGAEAALTNGLKFVKVILAAYQAKTPEAAKAAFSSALEDVSSRRDRYHNKVSVDIGALVGVSGQWQLYSGAVSASDATKNLPPLQLPEYSASGKLLSATRKGPPYAGAGAIYVPVGVQLGFDTGLRGPGALQSIGLLIYPIDVGAYLKVSSSQDTITWQEAFRVGAAVYARPWEKVPIDFGLGADVQPPIAQPYAEWRIYGFATLELPLFMLL